jgi:hypothetical protein
MFSANCDALPSGLTLSGSHLELHSDERRDETTWVNGRTIKVQCMPGFSLKPGSDDAWKCMQGYWEKTKSDRRVPECQQGRFLDVTGEFCFSRHAKYGIS